MAGDSPSRSQVPRASFGSSVPVDRLLFPAHWQGAQLEVRAGRRIMPVCDTGTAGSSLAHYAKH